jgi:hypothetical protein
VPTLLEQFILFVEKMVAAGREKLAVLVAVVITVVVDDSAPGINAVGPMSLLPCISQDAIGSVGVIPEASDILA